MEWLNLHTSVIRSPEYIGSEPVERATWINVLAYCCEQENGGVIIGAGDWKDRQWQQTCGVTLREVRRATRLLTWDGDDLRVHFYPVEKEAEVQAKREAGRAGGVRSGLARSKQTRSTASSTASSKNEAQLEAVSEGVLERKGREGKGKEGKLATLAARGEALLPESLNTPAMQTLWPNWLQHWSETFTRGKPMPEQTAHAQLRALVAIGPERACAAINNAIARGLREPAEPLAGSNAKAGTTNGGAVPWQRQSGDALKPGETF